MNIYSPTISGSLTISGSILTTGGGLPLTGSLVSSGSFTSIGNTTISGSLLVSGSAIALNINSGVLFVSSSGNVGIGTSNPSGILDVQKNQNTTTNFYLRNTDTTDANSRAYLNLISGTTTLVFKAISGDHSYIDSTSNLYFQSANSIKMTISSSGNVGIGTTSPVTILNIVSGVRGTPANSGTSPTNTSIRLNGVTNGVLDIGEYSSAAAGSYWMQVHDKSDQSFNYNLLLQLNGGNVGIGTSSPSYKLSVQGPNGGTAMSWTDAINNTGYLSIRASAAAIGADNNLVFETAAAEKMRITSGGSVLINRTSNAYESVYKFIVKNTTDVNLGFGIQGGEQSLEAFNDAINAGTPLRIYGNPIRMYNTIYFSSYSNGTLSISSGQVVSSSDKTLKTDDGGINNALDKVLQLNPRYFYWKEESGINTTERQLGFYAQDIQEALGNEVANDNGNGKWGIYDRGIIAMLTKAIQELTARVQELENK